MGFRPQGLVQLLAQQIGPPPLVINVPDEGVFNGDPPAGLVRVIGGSVQHFGHGPAVIHRNQGVSKLIVGGVQGNRQGDREVFVGKLADHRGHPHRRYGHIALRYPKPLGHGGGDLPHRGHHPLIVRQRLPHAHEHNVREPISLGRHGAGRRPNLVDDFPGGKVTVQPRLAGGAEWAGHAAPRLGGNAQGGAVGVAHEHGFQQGSVMQPPQGFVGFSIIRCHLPHRGHERGK